MEIVQKIPFNLNTLFVVSLLPFLHFGSHTAYWYRPDIVRLVDFLLRATSIILMALIGVRLVTGFDLNKIPELQIVFMHFPPALLTFLVPGWRGAGAGGGVIEMGGEEKETQSYKAVDLKKDVEEVTWDQLVIDDGLKSELMSVIDLLKDPERAKKYGIAVPKGLLLYGPPGTGKTTIAKAIAHYAELNFFVLRADEIVSKWVGESEKNLTRFFESAAEGAPAVIFIDEIDALGKQRSNNESGSGDSLLNHLLQLIDGFIKSEGIYIVGATNRADLVDDALKRPGRLSRTIVIPLPDAPSRRRLFEIYLEKLNLDEEVNIDAMVEVTQGLPAAGIREICNQAGLHAYKREQDSGNPEFKVQWKDLEKALSEFVKDKDDDDMDDSKAKQDFNPVPLNSEIEKLSWDDLIIDDGLRQELESVINLLKDPSTAKKYGIESPKGILLNGPPGTGKTTIAKVIATMSTLNFFVLQMDQVVSQWVGQSEKNLTKLFKAAKKHAPAVIFIDEVDSIAKSRSEGNAAHSDNLLNHLLQLIDGVVKTEGLYIIAATNRAELVDGALKRGGRLNRVIEIPLPNFDARYALFDLYLSKLQLAPEIDLAFLADVSEGKAGADIKAICNQAGLHAFKRESSGSGDRTYRVEWADMDQSLADFNINW